MDFQSARPRPFASSMLALDGVREGVVVRLFPTFSGRLDRNAPRQLMVRGTWKMAVSQSNTGRS
jgi:hypothetical protein